MKKPTPSASAFSAHAKSFERFVGEPGMAVEPTSNTRCQVYQFEAYAEPQFPPPVNYKAIGDLTDKWGRDEERRIALEEARRWVAESFHGDDGDTVKTLRLRKGWSQARLAEALGTSQSHVARIERGTENLAIGTCRKLAKTLGIDMNALDQALKRQEAIACAKRK